MRLHYEKYVICFLLICTLTGCGIHCTNNSRIDQLRLEIGKIPTNAANFDERMKTLWDWYNKIDDCYASVPTPPGLSYFYDVYGRYDSEAPGENEFRLMDEFLMKMDIVDGKRELVGKVWITPSDPVRARDYITLTLYYRVGPYGIKEGGFFSIHICNQVDMPPPQMKDPKAPDYLTVSTTGEAELSVEYKRNPDSPPNSYEGRCPSRLFVSVIKGSLKEGDEVILVYGDTTYGSPGIRAQSITQDDGRFYAETDYDATGVQRPVGWGTIKVVGSDPHRIVMVAPSFVKVNEKFPIKLRIEDKFGNVATGFQGTVHVQLNNKNITDAVFTKNRKLVTTLGPVSIDREDTLFFTAEDPVTGLSGRSNPVIVKKEINKYLFWGELHGHSHASDGMEQPHEYYEFARDVAFCDFAALTDHDFWFTDRDWKENSRITKSYNNSPHFVTFMAYEWTQNFRSDEGHHNVYYLDDTGPLVSVVHHPTEPELFSELKNRVDPERVIVIPHAHKPGTWTNLDPQIKLLAEIYSKHGMFEWYGNRFSARAPIGFVAGSDEHSGHPGNSQQGYWEVHGGITAVYAEKLNRSSLWEGLRKRCVYATTGCRAILDIRTEEGHMGDSITVSKPPVVTAVAVGDGPIEKIDIIRDGSIVQTKDLVKVERGNAGKRFLLKFFSPSDPGGDKYAAPLLDGAFEGIITLKNNSFKEFQPVGLDGWRDEIVRINDNEASVKVQMRGDVDGLLFALQSPNQGELLYNGKCGMFRFNLKNMPQEGCSYSQSDGIVTFLPHSRRTRKANPAIAIIRPVSDNSQDRVTISFKESERLTGMHYYYARLTHLDQSIAWSSPIWIVQE